MKLEIKEVVCDWGIYVDGQIYPFMIFNSKANAQGKSASIKQVYEESQENWVYKNSN